MEFTRRIREFIKGLEDRDLYKYMLITFSILFLTMGLLFYIHYRKVSRYTQELQAIDTERKQAKRILSDYKAITQQQAKIEQVLAQDPNFLISKKYREIIQNLNLANYQHEEPRREAGETVSGKIESILRPHLSSITMKQLTDLLSAIADVPQLYPKELIIKKTPNAHTIDVDLTIATLEPETTRE